jgi:hypothetical protein
MYVSHWQDDTFLTVKLKMLTQFQLKKAVMPHGINIDCSTVSQKSGKSTKDKSST